MLQPRRTVLLTIVILSTCGLLLRNVDCKTEVNDDSLDNEDDLHLHKPSEVDRVKRDAGDVTTVLLVDNTGRHRDGRFNKKAVGLLTSTARTFVQEGTTTEFATQVVGTTLDNGRLYAQVVTTSSRVFYNGDSGGRDKTRTKLDELVLPSIADIARPTEPIQVLPSRTDDSAIQVEPFGYAKSGNIYQTAVNEQHAPRSRYIGEPSISSQEPSEESHEPPDEAIRDELEALFLQAKARKQNRYFTQTKEDEGEVSENFVKSKRMDYFKRKNQVDGDNQDSGKNDVKPARVVRPLDGLPTFTIRHDFAPSGFSFDDNYEDSTESRTETSLKGSRFRSGKAFFKNRAEQRKLDTVTYLGFSDFTTTVGDTVIIFMPHTPAHDAHQGRKATSISGDATLAPELQHSASERTVSVVTSVKTFMSHTPGMVTRTITGHSLSMQTALPTMVVLPETSSASFSPQSVTIRRDKALSSAQVVEPVTEHPPTDFDDVAQYLAHEQSEMADKALTRTPEESVTEPLPGSEIIHPSSVSYNENVQSSIGTVIEPSPIETSTEDLGSSTATDTLGYFSTARTQTFDNGGAEFPLGLIKVIGGTEALNGTTTLFTSLIYGTTIDGNYAQIIHSTSSIFFYIDDTKVDMKIHPTAVFDSSSSATTTTSTPPITTDQEQTDGTTFPPTTLSDSTKEQPEITTDNNSITTFEQSTTEEDNKQTTVLDETLTTVPLEETTTEPNSDSINEVETGRKISSNPNDQVIIDFGDGKSSTLSPTSSSLLTQLIPSTVYKTFTYLTTFFIPAEGTSTTTSIRSREVTSSEINYVTRIFDPNIQSSMESPTVVTTGSVEVSSSIAISPSSSIQEERLQTTTPDGNTVGTTNQDEVTEQTTMTTPELPEEKTTVAPEENQITTTPSKTTIEGEEEEIELIFKTLYTTYTYLTTFFEESTTSVSSREVVVTNVVTSTVDRSYILTASDPAVAGLFGPDDGSVYSSSPEIAPTSVGIGRPTTKYYPDLGINPDEDLFSSVIESVDLEKELATPTPVLNNLASDDNELKTFYTTYTYFTTILVDGETEVESRTEIYTNIITPSGLLLNPSSTKIEPTISLREPLFENAEPSVLDQLESPHSSSYNVDYLESSQIRTPSLKSTPLYSYSSTINRSQRPSSEGIVVSNLPAPSVSSVNSADVDDEENGIFPKITQRVASSYATITRSRNIESSPVVLAEETTSKSPIASREVENIKSLSPVFIASSSVSDRPAVVETMSTDVTSSSSDGGRVMMLEKRNDKQPLLDDQISSESNTEALEPSPTLLLQTSFTTFTYFTTVYKGSSSDVISRLETITNIVTETLSPSAVPTISIPPEEATLPITYFTTFTYWTTLYRGSSTIVTSREETVSNVVTPTISPSTSIVLPLEITPSPTPTAVIVTPVTSTIPEPTTFYTTYTYFTTSYIGNSTVLSSRLETVTNIVNGSTSDATGRAVGSGATEQKIPTETVKPESSNKPSTALQPTGLLSTILTSQVNDGTTTLFSTDVYGTFIDGLYAQVLESSTQIVTAPLVSPTKANADLKPTGVVSLNEGKIIDAQGVSTTFFTTKAVGTYIDALYAEVVESTTSIYVNPERKSVLQQISPSNVEGVKTPKTGLVRIVEGSIIKDHTTTYYESKVIGTLIDGRYAQIIESTSSFKVEVSHTSVPSSAVNEIAPTSTLSPGISVTPTSSSTTSPTPAVIESSLNEGGNRDEDDENDEDDSDEGDGKKNKKSRLTFTSRKRTFTPVIRPFSSRNRPTFNPRRKTAIGSSATTITRTTVTPTVTATPAAKTETGGRGRFNNNRRGSSSGVYKTNYNDIRATPSGAGGRRPSRTRGSSVGVTSSSTHYTGRGRSSSGSTRLYASSVPGQTGASRRGSFFRSSTGRPGSSESYRGSSSGVHHATASSSRFRIRPTSSILGRGSTAYTTPSSDETLVPDDDLTTLITEETPHFTDDQQDAQTQPISTTTESPRRSNNPLLRFRRPPIPRSQSTTTTTPKPTTTQSSRRSPLLRRPASERGATTPRSRTSTRYNPVLSRQRNTNNLFPPRGLLKKPGKEEEDEEAKKESEDELQDEEHQEEGGEEHEDDEEFGDNDYEGSETSESKTKPNKSANRRSSKVYNPVQIKPFVGFNRKRTKRETEYGVRSAGGSTRSYTPRYRRPSSGTTRTVHESDEDLDTYEESSKPKVTPNTARFTPRPRNSAVTPSRIRPTSASSNTGRSQFTLRKDDTTSTNNRANFRRPTTPSPRRRTNNRPSEPVSTAQRPKPPRLRTQTNSRATEATTYSRSNSRARNPNTNRRGSGRTRSRGETSDYYDTYTYSQSSFDGTITVTHHIPTEVTIPVVNGKVTEYRNVITASPSTEVLGPHQYTVSTANNGITMIYLTSELVGTLPGGATEITQFVVHETPTTSVTFTPTVIRGHKTSYSHIIPSTVYDVEQVVSTVQPQISPNSPLANILLSQLLLGNLNLQPNLNPILALNNPATPGTPTTEYKTRQTTYVTTVTKGMSTVIPLTFRGKEILTTIIDSSTEVITATEFLTDTIVVTPTAGNNQLNSLLLPALLQAQLLQPQPQPMIPNPLLAGLQQQLLQQEHKPAQEPLFEDILSDRSSKHRHRLAEEADRLVRDSDKEILDDDTVQNFKNEEAIKDRSFKTARRKSKIEKKPPDPPPVPSQPETSIVTLYVSGRRPGEFSTVISTVTLGQESSATIKKREADFVEAEMFTVSASNVPEIGGSFPTSDDDGGYLDHYVMSAMNEISSIDSEIETQSLESIVGDVSQYVSSVIGESSSSSKLSLSKPSITEKPSSFATENKKKYFNKKNTAASSSNSTSVTGHFLSIGPAEFAPLKRKVLNEQNRGMDESTQIKQNSTSNTKNQIFKLSDIVVADCSNANKTSLTRNKRETEESFSQAQRRRRVRVRVPVNKKKTDESKYFNKAELLTVSEAQHTDVNIKDKNVGKSELEKYPQNLEFGSRRIKIIRGHKPAYLDEDNHEDDNEDEHYNENYQHRRRVVVTRRRRPEHILTEESNTDFFIPVTEPVVSEIPSLVDDILPITTYHPMELPIFITSNMLDDTDTDILPTTVRGDNVGQTTIPRRRVVITKKRPIASTTPTPSSHRRRIVVTKRRPISKIDSDIEPTNAIPDSMSTLYSYKYTVLNRENGLNTDAEKMVKVSQVYMSGKIPEEHLRDVGSTQTVKDYEKGESEESHTSGKSDKNEEETLTNDDITSKETSKKDDPAVISSIPELEMSTAEPVQIQPTQIESSFDVSSYDVGSETPLLSSGDAETVSLKDTDSATAVESSSVQNLEDAYKSSRKESHDNQEHKDESLDKHEEQDHHDEEVDDLHEHLEEDINDRSTESLSSQLHDSTPEGPRFIRPTRFSITRKPGNTKTGFPGRRRTSVGAPSASSSYTTSSNKYRSSYRGRKPSSPTSSTRTFGRSSKSSIHFFNTPTSSILEPTAVQEEEYVSPTVLESSYSIEVTSSDTLPSPIPETPEVETLSQAFLPVISSTTVTEVITSTRLRTYTYIVTRVAGDDQVVTSTTSVKPRVTTLTVTKTLPILATEFRGNEEGRGLNMNIAGEARYNLATKVMSNGVEVIVAGDKSTLPGEPEVLRVLSSSLSRPITLAPSTLTDHMVLFLPSDSSQVGAQLSSSLQHNAFVTKTYLTTYTYLTTFLQDGTTAVSSHEKIVSNVVTEERSGTSMMTPTPSVGFTLSASPSLSTGVFHTTYTYLNTLVDGDVPLVVTSHRTVANTLTAPQDYLQQLQPSGESILDTNTYLSTVAFTKTLTDGDDVKVVSTKDVLTQVVITESAKKPSDLKIPGSSPVPVQQGSITNIVKTYFVTYTYFSTFLEGGSTVIRSNIATSSDIVTEKFYVSPKRTMPPSFLPTPTPLVTPTSKIADKNSDFPLHLYATKTYLTTYTYFTTLLQDGGGDRTSTIVSSRTKIVQNVVTESVETSLLDPEYLESLRSSILADSTSSSSIVATATLSGGQQLKVTAMDHVIQPSSTKESEVTPTANHHELSSSMEETSNNLNNIITGSTIIFFDEDDQIDSSTSSRTLAIEVAGHTKATPSLSSVIPNSQIQSTLVNTGAATVLFPQDVVGAQPLVSSSPGAEPVPAPDNSFPIGLPSSLPLPFTFSPVAILTSILATSTITPNGATLQPGDQVIMMTEAGGNVTMIPVSDPSIKKPNGGFGPGGSEIQVSDLLSLGSLGINGLNALGPVINAMAGLIQNNLNQDKRRNDTTVIILPSTTPKTRPAPVYIPQNQGKPQDEGTTVRSPIYIPVGAVAGDTEDVDTAESQQYEGIVNLNGEVQWPTQGYPDTSQRRPAADPALNRPIEGALLGDGIPISPGQVITANSDVIVGKPAIMGPRPPKINNNKDEVPLGMKPPPLPPPPVWPNREVLPGHLPVREHGPGHVSLNKPFPPPPQSPNRNQHVPMRDHIPVHPPHRQHGHHPQVHHHSHSEGLPLLPPPMPKPEVGAHIIVDNENHIPAKVSPGSGLQTVFLGKPVPPGNDIIHGNPAPVPNTLDRSSGTPLLVNIQPSQVANVIIPSSTAPHIFNEHGAEFYDPSPYPLPESSPGFVGIDDNNHHNIPVHVGHQKPHVNQVSGTRMDFPPHEAVTIDHGNEGINVEISPGQGINVDVNPIHGINVDVSPGQGINVDVSPGQGLNVEISPGHFSQHGIKHEGERISPSGIVLDVPLQAGPGNEVLIGPPIRPVHNAHDHHRPSPPSLTGQVPPPPPPHKIPSNKHVQTSTPQNHKFLHPPRPTDFMVPPPPPVIHHSQDSFHNSGNHGPIIPLNPNGPHHPGPKTEDFLIQLDDKDEPLEVEGGEVIEESNQRPVRPGQIPVEVQLANSASTHRPVVVRPPQKNHGSMSHDEGLHQMKPPHSMFDKPLLPDAPIKPHPEIRPHKPNHEGRPHRPKPQTTVPKRPQASHNSETHSHERPVFEIPGDSKPEIIIESRPHVTNNNRHNMKNKPFVHIDEISNKPQHHNHRPENNPTNSFGHQPQPGNKPIEVKVDRPHQSIFDKQDDIYKSTPDSRFDLETQANTPRPFSVLPAPQNGPTFDFNSDEIVVGMSPPPPRVTPVSNNGQRFPVLGIEPQVSTHRPIVNIGGQRRPPNRNKPRPQPPYKFELPETTVTTTEAPTTAQKTSTSRPFWIRPALHEISSPVSSSKPVRNEDENFIKKPSSSQDAIHNHRRPITTWRPPLAPDRPRPVKPLVTHPAEPENKHTHNGESSISLDKIVPGSVKPAQSQPTAVLQTVVVGKPIPQEPVISPTTVKESIKKKQPATAFAGHDIIVGSEKPIIEESIISQATPSVSVYRRKSSVPSIASTIISTGSKTIYGNLFTKPTPSSTVSSKPTAYKPISSFSGVHHKDNKDSQSSNLDNEDEDDLEFDDKVNHKTDLGVASSNEDKIIYSHVEVPTRYFTHTHTHTVTFTETTVISSRGHQPSTRTVIVTKTQTSTLVDTVTETKIHTLVQPTSVTATVTTTVSATPSVYSPGVLFDPNNYQSSPKKPLSSSPVQEGVEKVRIEESHSVSTSVETHVSHGEKNSFEPGKENDTNNKGVSVHAQPGENESFFVIVNDQKPATINVNKGSSNDGDYNDKEDEIANSDESDPNSDVNHAVLLGGVLIAAPPRHNTPATHPSDGEQGGSTCRPDCSAARNELCQRVEGRMRCVCRPGFARMFPDRPCKPTYTYTMKLGLARHGKETLRYDDALSDSASPHYRQLAEATREGLDRMVMQSDLRDIYHGVIVNGFQPTEREAGVTVNFHVQLSDNIDESRLQDVFRKSLRTTNFSLGGTEMFAHREMLHNIKADDFDECSSSQFHDCSEHAQCFNLRGTYTCSCQDGYTDLSENPLFPGRLCSADLIGCEKCHYHGTCYSRGDDQVMCECFQWYAGDNCQINLKVLLIALVTIGAVLLGLLIVCVVLTCLKRSSQRVHGSGTGFLRYRSPTHTLDKRAMIQDSSSEGSVADHGPISYLTPTHQPASTYGSQMKPALVHASGRKVSGTVELSDENIYSDQRDRSLTVMIPRAKYRPIPPTSPLLAMSTFGVEQKRAIAQEQQKLLSYLETGNKQESRPSGNARRKQSNSTNHTTDTAPPPSRKSSAPRKPSTGALVSAGFEVSATVGRKELDSDTDGASAAIVHGGGGGDGTNINNNTLASSGSHFTTMRTNDSEIIVDIEPVPESTTDSQQDTNSRVQELTVSEARSFDETTVQPPTKSLHSNYGSNPSSRNPNDEAHTMAERDLGSTLLMPQTHLYKPDRGSDISNFDSL